MSCPADEVDIISSCMIIYMVNNMNRNHLQQRVLSSVVEHLTADQEVTGSNPVGP